MKILFSADQHIKLGQKNVPKDWQINRLRMYFEKLKGLAHEADITVLGGDIFDRMPNIEELQLYFELLASLRLHKTIIYPGNHEMVTKRRSFFEHLKPATEAFNSNIEVILEPCERYGCDIIPYNYIKSFDPNSFHNDILLTHIRGEIAPHVKPEIDLERLDRWKVVLAGDLHSYSNCQRNILYPGSPYSTSFHRSSIRNGVIIFDTDTFSHDWIELDLPQLIRKTVTSEDEMIATDYHHTIYELEGSELELKDIKNKDLLDKKISTKKEQSTLNLANMSIDQELQLYLSDVVNLKDGELREVLGVYNDYIA